MRKIVIISALLIVTLSNNAQTEKGRLTIQPRVGATLSSFTGGGSSGATGKFGFMGCIDAEYGVSQLWSVSAGVGYMQFGASDYSEKQTLGSITNYELQKSYLLYVIEKNSMKYTLDYLTVPIMIGFHPYRGLSLRAGVQIGACVRTYAKGYMYVATMANPKEEDSNPSIMTGLSGLEYDGDFDSGINKLDIGIPVSMSYEFGNVVLDARYVFGLLNVNKEDMGGHMRNSAFSVTVGYKFTVAK